MALTDDVRQVIAILQEEGFEALAGELMSEVSLGRPHEERKEAEAEAVDDEIEMTIIRVPLEDRDQIEYAMELLRLRLVEPVQAFAEAERLASELNEGQAVKIEFIDPNDGSETVPVSTRDSGDASVVEKLDELLQRLPTMTVPTISGGA